jgi:hypothetical protein
MEAGRIIERGTHQSLYAARGRYYDLYTKQHGIEANLFLTTEEQGPEPEETSADEEQDNGNTRDSTLVDSIRLIRERET